LLLAALLVIAGSGFALDGDAPSGDIAAETTADAPAFSHQLRAHIDPETGGLTLRRMPVQLSETLQNAVSRSDEGLVPMTLPNGTQLLHLQGRFQTLSFLRLGDRGAELTCTHDAATVSNVPTATHISNAPADR